MKSPTNRIASFDPDLIRLSFDVNELGMPIEDAIKNSLHSIFSSSKTIQEVLAEP